MPETEKARRKSVKRLSKRVEPLAERGPVVDIDAATRQRMIYYMILTRELEHRIERKLYRQGKIVGGVYVGRGQEAIGVGTCILTRPDALLDLGQKRGVILPQRLAYIPSPSKFV